MTRELTEPVPDPAAIDHGWLQSQLGWPLRGDEAIAVRSVSHSAGDMGAVHEVSCAGRRMIFKGPPADPGLWDGLVARTGLMAREVHLYRLLQARGPSAAKVAPACLWSALDHDGSGALALEHVGPAPDLPTVMASGLSRAEAGAATRSLAIVHSTLASRTSDALSPPHTWLYTAASAGLAAWVRTGLADLLRMVAACWPGDLPGTSLRRIRDVDVDAVLMRSHVGANCVSLCHGDAWAGNVLFAAGVNGQRLHAYLIDWQFAMWGNPLSDVALLLMSSLAPAARKAWEHELLELYHATLTAHCDLEYALDACRDDLRRAEPFAALVALATLEAYTSGMGPAEHARFSTRVVAAVERVLRPEA